MTKRIKFITLLISAIFLFLFSPKVIQADEMDFSWEVKQSENQRDKTKTYFDLRVTPGEKENLEIELKNTSDKEITVVVETNTAVTNNNGVIDYGMKEPKLDKTLKYPFSTLAKTDPEVTLKPKENKKITIEVDIPSEPFDGIILGGIRLSQKETGSNNKEQSGVQIENKFAVVIGVRLSENDKDVEPNMQLLDVKPGQRNYRNVILANLQNPQPRILSGITVIADVYAANNTTAPLYHSKQEKLQMAPNSNFNYGITMNNKAFKPGKYLLKMTTQADGKEWKFEKEFEIKATEAKKFNEEAVELAEEPVNYTFYIIMGIIVLIIIVVIVVGLIIYSKNKKDTTTKSSSKKRTSKS